MRALAGAFDLITGVDDAVDDETAFILRAG